MRVQRVLLSVIVAVTFHVCTANALDFGRAARGIVGQVLDNAVRGGSAPVQQQPQQQQGRVYNSYEEYMAAQNGVQNDSGTQAAPATETMETMLDGDDTDTDMLATSESDDDDLFGNDATEAEEEDGDLFGNAGSDDTESGDAEGSDIIEVVATGVGKDSDSALRSALRAAVEQAVGTLIDSETLIENDEAVNDKILSYSAGFVQSHKQIGSPKTQDGLVTIKIRAQVKKTELTQKLEAASIHVTDVDGEDLFGAAVSKIEQNQAAEEIVKKAFEGYPFNVMEIRRSGKPEYNERDKKWIIPVELSVNRDKYRTFIRGLAPILKKVSTDAPKRITMNTGKDQDYLRINNMGDIKGNFILICISINDAKTTTIWEAYPTPEEAINGMRAAVRAPKFTVDIVDNQGDPITSGTYNAPVPYYVDRGNGSGVVIPLFNDGIGRSYYKGDKVTYNLSFDVSPDEFKRMKNVVTRIDK